MQCCRDTREKKIDLRVPKKIKKQKKNWWGGSNQKKIDPRVSWKI